MASPVGREVLPKQQEVRIHCRSGAPLKSSGAPRLALTLTLLTQGQGLTEF